MNTGTIVLSKIAVNGNYIVTTNTIMGYSVPSCSITNNIPTGVVGDEGWAANQRRSTDHWVWRGVWARLVGVTGGLGKAIVIACHYGTHYAVYGECGTPSGPRRRVDVRAVGGLPRVCFAGVANNRPFVEDSLGSVIHRLCGGDSEVIVSAGNFFASEVVSLYGRFPGINVEVSVRKLRSAGGTVHNLRGKFGENCAALGGLIRVGRPSINFKVAIRSTGTGSLIPLCRLSGRVGVRFTATSLRGSFCFIRTGGVVGSEPVITRGFRGLVGRLLGDGDPGG